MKGLPSSAMDYIAPPLVIEIVSTNWRDDYLTKLAEYESICVEEYWIVDYGALGGMRCIGHPKQPMLSIYTMDSETGEFRMPQQFRGENSIKSAAVPELAVTAKVYGKKIRDIVNGTASGTQHQPLKKRLGV